MARSITLTRNSQMTGTVYDLTGFRFTVTASAASGLNAAIFRYLRKPIDPANVGAGQVDEFNGLCTPEEMASLPLNNPIANSDPAWCRKTTLDLVFATTAEAAETWDMIKADVLTLLKTLDRMDNLTQQEVAVIST